MTKVSFFDDPEISKLYSEALFLEINVEDILPGCGRDYPQIRPRGNQFNDLTVFFEDGDYLILGVEIDPNIGIKHSAGVAYPYKHLNGLYYSWSGPRPDCNKNQFSYFHMRFVRISRFNEDFSVEKMKENLSSSINTPLGYNEKKVLNTVKIFCDEFGAAKSKFDDLPGRINSSSPVKTGIHEVIKSNNLSSISKMNIHQRRIMKNLLYNPGVFSDGVIKKAYDFITVHSIHEE